MHSKGRTRGQNIRYVKNPSRTFFKYSQPLSEVRAIKGQHVIAKNTTPRQPNLPDRDIPVANKPKKP
jgi:hypothetical protein